MPRHGPLAMALGAVAALLWLAACAGPAPAAWPSAAAAPQPAAPLGWEDTVAAARAEGKLIVRTRPTTNWRKVFDALQ